MNLHICRLLITLFIALSQTACASTTTDVFRGEMELAKTSGSACSKEDTSGKLLPDSDRAYLTSIAVAHVMAGREGEALKLLRGLFHDPFKLGIDLLKQRMIISGAICAYANKPDGDARQKASLRFIDAMAHEFGSLNGVGVILAECYRDLGKEMKEQDDPGQSMVYFQKALELSPDDAEIIYGIVVNHIAMGTAAEGRQFYEKHAPVVIDKVGRNNFDTSMSYLYAAEAKQAEKSGDLPRAEQLLREALKLLPGEVGHNINLARVLGKTAKSGEARKLLEDARNRCGDETCRREYTDELARQDHIAQMVKRLERQP